MFVIEFKNWCDAKGREITDPELIHGYNTHDYLPGWREERFDTYEAGFAWLERHHLGPDVEGIWPKFVVVKE